MTSPTPQSRRQFLSNCTYGLSTVALGHLLQQEGLLAAPAKPDLEHQRFDLTQKSPVAEPQAKAMISLFMQGGPSHLDLFDPKPGLDRLWAMERRAPKFAKAA